MCRLILIAISLLFCSTPAIAGSASSDRWIVTQRSGDARVVRPGLQPASLTANQPLTPGDMIVTGPSGRATLAHGADYIVVAPRSQLRLPAKSQKSGFTSIIQDLGTMLYKVRHTGVPHFSVDTPMLAAVVKGTTFTVVVENERSAVQVIEGIVEVTAVDGGMRNLVHGGRTVFVDRNNPKSLITADAVSLGRPSDNDGEAIKITGTESTAALDITTLTAAQVRVETPKVDAAVTVVANTATGDMPVAGIAVPVTDVVSDVVAPVTDVVLDVAAPVTDIVSPVVAPVTQVIAPVVAPVTQVIEPVVTPVTQVIAPVVAPVTQVIAPVVAPVTQVIAPVVAPVTQVIAPVVAPITQVIAPVVAPITQGIAPILGL